MENKLREEKKESILAWTLQRFAPAFRAVYQWFLRLIWLVPPIIVLSAMLSLYSENGLYPYGNKTVSWCDMDQQVVPLLMDFKDVLSGKEGFFFSFKNAGGMNFYGVFFFFLASPFTFLIAFVEKGDIALFVNILVMLKMCAMAGTASFYLAKKHPKAWLMNIALSTLYAYSGYTMMYYQNMIWLDIAYLFPLLLLGLERLKEGKRALFICVLSACMVVNYYLGYMIVVFLLLYAFVWTLLSKDKKFAGNFLLSCAVAALLSAVVWLPSFIQYFSSGRKTSIVENLRNSGMLTPYQTALPTVFSILFLFPFALGAKSETDENVRLRFVLFIATVIPLFIEPIAKMWQTGSYMSFPTRYAFITIFLCITLAMDTASKWAKEEEQALGTRWQKMVKKAPMYALNVGIVLLAAWYYVFSIRYTKQHAETMDQYSQSLWGNAASFEALFTLYAVALVVGSILFLLHRFRLLKPVMLWVAVGVLVLSELYIAPVTYMLTPAHGVEWLQDVTEMADVIDDEGFYRVKSDKEYSGRDFDANLMGSLGYNALGHYTSLTGGNYMTAIKRFGYTSYWMEVGNSGGTLLSDALLSVKYSISSQKTDADVAQGGYYGISKTLASLPLGVLTKKDIIAEKTDFSDRANLQKTLYQDFFGSENGVTVYELNDATLENLTVTEQADGKYVLAPKSNKTGKIIFHINTSEKETLYFNVFGENTNALKQSINGKFSISAPSCHKSNFPGQKENGLLSLGAYQNQSFNVTVSVSGEVQVSELGLVGIKNGQLVSDIENARTLDMQTGKNEIVGRYTAEGGECVFLSVPYDRGMKLKINGKRAELYEVYDGFTAFYLKAGENEISITFTPQGFGFGVAACVVGLGLCAALIAWWILKKKRWEMPPMVEVIAYYGVIAAGVAVVLTVYLFPIILCAL